jgi:hypothetical protein
MYSRCRPIRSAAQPVTMLPANTPISADAPISPCQNEPSPICGAISVSAMPMIPSW